MYVAVKGGEAAIANAHGCSPTAAAATARCRRCGSTRSSSSSASPSIASWARARSTTRSSRRSRIMQARGDLIEAIFLVRAYRTTLPRFGYSQPIDTGEMLIERRISATFKDLPGGQLLGPTFDYTHRLLDPVARRGRRGAGRAGSARPMTRPTPRVTDLLGA